MPLKKRTVRFISTSHESFIRDLFSNYSLQKNALKNTLPIIDANMYLSGFMAMSILSFAKIMQMPYN